MPRHLRIFLASPGDVTNERTLARKVIERLPYDPLLRGKLTVEVVAWDKPGAGTPMLATMSPQEAIAQGLPKPSECDVVIVIFWSRMGTPLPETWVKPEQFRYFSGSDWNHLHARYLSGTEWEYFDALKASEASSQPEILVYRRTEEPVFRSSDPKMKENIGQWELANAFFAFFRNPDGSILRGYNEYDAPAGLERELENHLKSLIKKIIEAPEPDTKQAVQSTAPTEPPLWQGSPFPGLRAFTDHDAPIFFGRGRETDDLLHKLADPTHRFIAVVGASGSGKSSLVWSGLIPRLNDGAIEGSQDWAWVRFTPGELGDNPFLALADGFKRTLQKQGRKVRETAQRLHANPETMNAVVELALEDRPDWSELLLFID